MNLIQVYTIVQENGIYDRRILAQGYRDTRIQEYKSAFIRWNEFTLKEYRDYGYTRVTHGYKETNRTT